MEDVQYREQAAGQGGCVVVNDAGVVLGHLSSDRFEAAFETIVEQAIEPGPATIRPHVSLTEITEYMQKRDIDKILVAIPDGELIGLLYRQDAEQMRRQVPPTSRQSCGSDPALLLEGAGAGESEMAAHDT